jgi:hypothetical protein
MMAERRVVRRGRPARERHGLRPRHHQTNHQAQCEFHHHRHFKLNVLDCESTQNFLVWRDGVQGIMLRGSPNIPLMQ